VRAEVATVEVAHEALFRSWARLKDWIALAQEDLILLRQVRNAAHDWQTKREREPGKDFDYLRWNAERLTLVDAMIERLKPDLNAIEQDFIEPEQARLLREIDLIQTDHKRRRWIGERLATIGDPRSGIGLLFLPSPREAVEEGRETSFSGVRAVPQIDWLPVTPGGEIGIEGKRYPVQPFYVARYLITYRQFQAFLDAPDGFEDEQWWRGFPEDYIRQEMVAAVAQYDNYPRDSISWYQSVAFSRWMNHRYQGMALPNPVVGTPFLVSETAADAQKRVPTSDDWIIGENAEIRLPTEQEWQWMAQNETEARKYPWGAWDGHPRANTTEAGIGDRSTAVGMYPHGAAECGALDVAGNLWEWCLNDYKSPDITEGYGNGQSKVLRGGSFGLYQSLAAASYRNYGDPDRRNYAYGLRLVCAAPSASLNSVESDL
jgi:formylglycine-generating enzyme required for sulfatase activity